MLPPVHYGMRTDASPHGDASMCEAPRTLVPRALLMDPRAPQRHGRRTDVPVGELDGGRTGHTSIPDAIAAGALTAAKAFAAPSPPTERPGA